MKTYSSASAACAILKAEAIVDKPLHGKRISLGGIVSALIVILLLSACADRRAQSELTIRIDNALSRNQKALLMYDGSLTGGETEMNAYRVTVADDSGIIADSGPVTKDELVLKGIIPGTYSFTVQGLITGGGESIAVAENTMDADTSSGSVTLPLTDIAEGTAGEISLRVYQPLSGSYDPSHAAITFLGDGYRKSFSASGDSEADYAGSGSDGRGAYWDYRVLTAASIPAGWCEGSVSVPSSSGDETADGVFAGLLYPSVSAKGTVSMDWGVKKVATPVLRLGDVLPERTDASVAGVSYPVILENADAYSDDTVVTLESYHPDTASTDSYTFTIADMRAKNTNLYMLLQFYDLTEDEYPDNMVGVIQTGSIEKVTVILSRSGYKDSEPAEVEVKSVTVPMALPDGSVLFYDRGEEYGEYCIGEDGYPVRLTSGVDDGSATSAYWRYLICDQTDLDNGGKEWGPYTNEGLNPGTVDDFGYGLSHTEAMLAKYADNDTYWWKLIKEKRDNTGLNWFMPSLGELFILYSYKDIIPSFGGVALQTDYYYWSSTESGRISAYLHDFSEDYWHSNYKNSEWHCRLFRRI